MLRKKQRVGGRRAAHAARQILWAMTSVYLIGSLLAGCTHANHAAAPAAITPGAEHTASKPLAATPDISSGAPTSLAPAQSGASATESVMDFCMLDHPPADLSRLLEKSRVHWPNGVEGLAGVLPDGSLAVTMRFPDGGRGLGLMQPGSQDVREIYRFAKVSDGPAVGEITKSDGFVVFHDAESPTDNSKWSMVEVDLATGQSRTIGGPNPGIAAEPLAMIPSAGDGYVSWAQSRADEALEVHVVNLKTGATRVLPYDLNLPVIVGDTLIAVYSSSRRWNVKTGYFLVAFDLDTLRQVPLPSSLQGITDSRDLAVTNDGVIWNAADFSAIYARSPANPGVLFRARSSREPNPSMEDWPYLSSDGFASWFQNGGGPGSGVLGDVRTGVAVSVGNDVHIVGHTVHIFTITSSTSSYDTIFTTDELPRLTGCDPTPAATQAPSAPATPTLVPDVPID